ncbi:class I SAM-dependent methyltransferase [Methanolobus sp. ZRKC2]|uniref:class I SAM-dependent methyltransferase n=1 Tax=Methanolobus sp. ZRKC2 TaxID=3125783 RepID=UPI003253470C
MTKIKPQITNDIAETLFITLFMRSEETKHPKAIIQDPKACELVDCIDYDFSKFRKGKWSCIGTSIRVRHFDNMVAQFIKNKSRPVVVLVGCGLDTRYHRVPNNTKAVFYELDLPEVIKLREKFLPPETNQEYISASMLETGWMDMLKAKHPEGDFIFIIEGVLMYFPEDQVKTVISNLAQYFPGSEIHFDAMSPWASKQSHRHDTVKHVNADFRWGLKAPKDVERWATNIKHRQTFYYMNQEKGRWGMKGTILGMIPRIKKSACLLHYDVLK